MIPGFLFRYANHLFKCKGNDKHFYKHLNVLLVWRFKIRISHLASLYAENSGEKLLLLDLRVGCSLDKGLLSFWSMLLSFPSRASHFTPRWKGSEKSEMVNPRWRTVILAVLGREAERGNCLKTRGQILRIKSFSKAVVLSATLEPKVQKVQRQWGKHLIIS